jgi:ubiquinone/menaquinone biosynthesis C-methylase UbiE
MTEINRDKIISDWYDPKNFNTIYYSGLNKFLSKKWHKLLERDRDLFYTNVLEVAATHGQHFLFVRHNFSRYIMTDLYINEELKKMGDIDSRIEILEQDATTLNLIESGSIDRMISTCLLHHLQKPELVIEQFTRVARLNSEAIFDIFIPNEGTFIWNFARVLFIFPTAKKVGWKWSQYWKYVKTDHIRTTSSVLNIIEQHAEKFNLEFELISYPKSMPIRSFRPYYRATLKKKEI